MTLKITSAPGLTPEFIAKKLAGEGVEARKSGDGYMTQCPKHIDKHPSLAVFYDKNGLITWECKSGCDWKEIKAELKRLGLDPRVVAKKEKAMEVVEDYLYCHADGRISYKKTRYKLKDGGKICPFYYPDPKATKQSKTPGRSAGWIKSDKVEGEKPDHLLYDLPGVAAAAQAKDVLVFVEGETDKRTCNEWSYPATCLDTGSKSHWQERYAEDCKGCSVYVCHDYDHEGYEYSNMLCEQFTAAGFVVHWVDLPGIEALGKKGADITDWKNAGHNQVEFDSAISDAFVWTEPVKCPLPEIVKERPLSIPRKQEDNIIFLNSDSELVWSDRAMGSYFVEKYSHNVRYANCIGWFLWDERRFLFDSDRKGVERMARAVGDYATGLVQNTSMEARQRSRALTFVQSVRARNNLLADASSAPEILCESSEFDSNPNILNTSSGMIDLTSGKLVDHDRRAMCSKLIEPTVSFDLRAQCPRFLQFLGEIFPGEEGIETIQFLQRAIGYSLTPDVSEDKFFFCYGAGRNGKSVLLELFTWLLGEYAGSSQIEMWMKRVQRDHAESFIHFIGKRFVTAGEVKQGDKLDEGRVKSFTGKDTIKTRALHKHNTVDFKPTAKLWMFGNHKPLISDMTHSIWSRMLLIPFEVQIDKPDKYLLEKLKLEAEGILCWAIVGTMLWREMSLAPSAKIERAVADYKAEMDTPNLFLEDCCELDADGAFIVRSDTEGERVIDVYTAYLAWCKESGQRYPKTMIMFCKALAHLKNDRRTEEGFYYKVQLKDEWKPPDQTAEQKAASRFGKKHRESNQQQQHFSYSDRD